MIDAQTQNAIVQGVLYGISILGVAAMVLLGMLVLVSLIPKLRKSMGYRTTGRRPW